MKAKHIIIDCRMFGEKFTGIGVYNLMLVKELIKIDTLNHYTLLINQTHPFFKQLPANFKTKQVNCPVYSLSEQIKLVKILYKLKADLVHFTNFNQPLLYFKKQITTIHDLTLFFYKGKKHKNIFSRLMFYLVFLKSTICSTKIICVSKHTQTDLAKKFPNTKHKSQVIYLGFKQIQLKATRVKELIKDKFILYTGNWREHKNLPNLIRAFNILKNKYKIPHKLVLTGKPNPLYPETQKLIKQFKLQKSIFRAGLVESPKLTWLFQNASVYVQPSFYEGFGLPLLEALSQNTSVCASKTSCLPEIAQNCANYFDPNSPEEMAKTIKQNLDKKPNPNHTSKLLKQYSWERAADQTHKLYLSCLNK